MNSQPHYENGLSQASQMPNSHATTHTEATEGSEPRLTEGPILGMLEPEEEEPRTQEYTKQCPHRKTKHTHNKALWLTNATMNTHQRTNEGR